MSPIFSTWSAATVTTRLYSFRGTPGQLPSVESAEINALLLQLTGGEHTWLGAGRDEYFTFSGIVWSAGPNHGQQFYSGVNQANGSVIGGFYTNFSLGQPDTSGGGMFMLADGAWFQSASLAFS